MEDSKIRDWETPMFDALMLSFDSFRERLKENRGYKLNAKPREVDIRIIDMEAEKTGFKHMDHAIGHLFERHNLVEIKNPSEKLNIDTVWKGISYAAQYVRFFNSLKVDSEKQMADTIMDVSIAENRSLYGRIKEEDPIMSKALAELMKDEIEEQVKQKVEEQVKQKVEEQVKQRVEEQVKQKVEQSMNIRNEDIATKMLRKSKPVSEIVEFTNVGLDRIKEIARTIGVVPVI